MPPNDNQQGRSLIVGRNPVREALQRGDARIEKVLIQKSAGDQVRRAAEEAGVQVQYVPAARLAEVASGLNHQGVVAIAAPVQYQDVDEMLAEIAPTRDAVRDQQPMLLLIDQVTDPHNFGAMMRSAVAMGADGVIVPQRNMAPISAVTLKASAGTAPRIPIARVKNLSRTIEQLKERAYWIAGADGDGNTSLWDMDWDRPLALVMGSEGQGLRRRVADACDFRVRIPLQGPAESLNVSVATGILLAAAARSRLARAAEPSSAAH